MQFCLIPRPVRMKKLGSDVMKMKVPAIGCSNMLRVKHFSQVTLLRLLSG